MGWLLEGNTGAKEGLPRSDGFSGLIRRKH